ncbi:hypothetical protein GCM10027033_00960 [Leucobacter ruminantium]
MRLPLVQMTVHEGGAMTVLVDGTVYPPPQHAPAWSRASFSMILDAITAQLGQAVKVVVTESDGSTFTDIATPVRRRASYIAPTPAPTAAPTPQPAHHHDGISAPGPMLSVSGSGFLAGEDVAVAVVLTHTSAAPDGRVSAHVAAPPELVGAGSGELVLLGRISETVSIVRAAS